MTTTTSINLSSLDGTNGFHLDAGGGMVSNAGDINGDGFDDVIIDTNSYSSYGDAGYVVFGKASGFSAQLDLSSLDGGNGFILHGTQHKPCLG